MAYESNIPPTKSDEAEEIFYGKYDPLVAQFRCLLLAEEQADGSTLSDLDYKTVMFRFVQELRKVLTNTDQ